jgi:lipoprotein signal peptidase
MLFGIAAAFFWADQASKAWTFGHLSATPIHLDRDLLLADPQFDPVGPDVASDLLPWRLLEARLVLNPGAVFGIGANHRWFFVAFSVLALFVVLFIFARHTRANHWLAHVALALILAGGAGNLYDRLAIGRVRDFLHLFPGHCTPFGWTWPGTSNNELFPWVFNVADVLLLVGMVCLMHHLQRRRIAAATGHRASNVISRQLLTIDD